MLTTPRYSCRATVESEGTCRVLGDGLFTWAGKTQMALGMTFAPVDSLPSFALPDTLWLLGDRNYGGAYRPLATFGLGSLVALSGETLHAVESLPDASCPSGRRLVYVVRRVPDMAVTAQTSLACEWRQVLPPAGPFEVPYAATAVKWLGPWAADFVLFVATDVQHHVYHRLGEADTSTGNATLEHVSFQDQRSGLVRLGGRLCAFLTECLNALPDDRSAMRGSVWEDSAACVEHLIREGRASATDADWRGRPLLLYARTPAMALLLAARGADLEAKDAAGETSLMVMALHRQSLAAHLEHGAALCTWPLSVFSADARAASSPVLWRRGVLRVPGSALSYPCERGFFLREGVKCTGLAPCPAGFFCPGYTQRTNERFPCPAGTWSDRAGLVSAAQCTPCPESRPLSPPGSDDITLCRRPTAVRTAGMPAPPPAALAHT